MCGEVRGDPDARMEERMEGDLGVGGGDGQHPQGQLSVGGS